MHRGRVSYEPNSLGGGCPFQAGMRGFTSFPQPIRRRQGPRQAGEVRRPLHAGAAVLESQTPVEQAHIVRGFRFELTQGADCRRSASAMVASARQCRRTSWRSASPRGSASPSPHRCRRVLESPPQPEVETLAGALPLGAAGGRRDRRRRVAILVADGLDAAGAAAVHEALARAGAVPRFVGSRLGAVQGANGGTIEIEATLEAAPQCCSTRSSCRTEMSRSRGCAAAGQAVEFVKDQYRHCKPMLVLGAGGALLSKAGVPTLLPGGAPDPGIVSLKAKGAAPPIEAFIAALAKHRHFEREIDPPPV